MMGSRAPASARRLVRYVVVVAMLVVGLLLCLDLAYLVRGSLEEFPTDEDHGKVRLVTTAIAGALLVAELGLGFLLRSLSARGGSGAALGKQ